MTRLLSRVSTVVLVLCAGLPLLAQSPKLKSRDPLIAPEPGANAVPEGQTFLIRLNDTLDTTKLKAGKKF